MTFFRDIMVGNIIFYNFCGLGSVTRQVWLLKLRIDCIFNTFIMKLSILFKKCNFKLVLTALIIYE